MPVTPSYTWNENEQSVVVNVEIKNAVAAKLDIDVTDLFFKINYSPFLLVLDFAHEVVYARAAAAVTDECVVLTFPKATPGVAWGALAPTPALAKSELLARRSAAAERKAASDAAERERREKTKHDVKKHVMHTQWAVEHAYKDMMVQLQQDDKKEAEDEIQQFLDAQHAPASAAGNPDATKAASSSATASQHSAAAAPAAAKKGIVWSEELTSERKFDTNLAPNTHKQRLREPPAKRAEPAHSILKGSATAASSSSSLSPTGSPAASPVAAAPAPAPKPKVAAFQSGGVTIEELSDDEDEARAKKAAAAAAARKRQEAEAAVAAHERDNPIEFDPRVPRSEYLSQAQLLAKLREKIEADAAAPVHQNTHAVPVRAAGEADIFTAADVGDDEEDEEGPVAPSQRAATAAKPTRSQGASAGATPTPVGPPVRSNAGKVEIQFTPTTRGGPGPARNSRLNPSGAADGVVSTPAPPPRDSAAAADAHTDLGEQQPVFLKERGDVMFKRGDFQGALGAYGEALKLDAGYVPARANRAACYLRMADALQPTEASSSPTDSDSVAAADAANAAPTTKTTFPASHDVARLRTWLAACISDCDRALHILCAAEERAHRDAVAACVPCTWQLSAAEAHLRAKLMLRRGMARHACGDAAGAAHDLAAAAQLQPHDAKFAADAQRVQQLATDYAYERHQTIKKQGDAAYQRRALDEACALYARALVVCPPFVTCLANRAAAHLVAHRYAACVYDCTLALAHLDAPPVPSATATGTVQSSPPIPASGAGAVAAATAAAGAASLATSTAVNAAAAVAPIASSLGACVEAQLSDAERRRLRVRLLARRGAAHVGAENLVAAKRDYESAVACDPHDAALIQDLQRIHTRLRENNQSAAAAAAAADTVAATTAAGTTVPTATTTTTTGGDAASASFGSDTSAEAPVATATSTQSPPPTSPSATSESPKSALASPPHATGAGATATVSALSSATAAASAAAPSTLAQAEALMRAGEYAAARTLFATAASSSSSSVAGVRSLLNRAACALALRDCAAAVAECNRALEVLVAVQQSARADRHPSSTGGAGVTSVTGGNSGDAAECARLECVALVRRAAACAWMGDAQLAVEDLRAAIALGESDGSGATMSAHELQCARADLLSAERGAGGQRATSVRA